MDNRTIYERFSSKVRINEESGCWEWTAQLDKDGYGRFSVNRIPRVAHRVSYELHCGPIPGGLIICHRCDNASCVNPSHLFLGTQAENMADKVRKGRQIRGKTHHRCMAKLTEPDVLAIRAAARTPGMQYALAAQYGVGQDEISRIVTRKRWGHI